MTVIEEEEDQYIDFLIIRAASDYFLKKTLLITAEKIVNNIPVWCIKVLPSIQCGLLSV